ncbi:MAG: glucose 1-dehydrogenase [Alphaproteobacteria bacterium]|nr:glucose 1-dehydrogenase [Alphaproteobacteria bacterium]
MGRLADKVVIVTGGTAGIGRGTAALLAAEGARVVVTGRQEAAGRDTVAAIAAQGGTAHYMRQDVTLEADWPTTIAATVKKFGRLDALVNNAGDCILKPIEDLSLDVVRAMVRINLEAAFLGVKHALPVIAKTGGGAIVNISSAAGLKGGIGGTGYSAGKGALVAFSRAAALEAREKNVRINVVHPGFVWGPGVIDAMGEEGAKRFRAACIARTPMKRVGVPEDIGAMVLYLVSDESRFVVGADVTVDGGYMAV